MEEVIGSIPIRSTNLAPLLGVNWCQFWVDTRAPFPLSSAHLSAHHACLRSRSARLPKLIMDRTSNLCYGLRDDFLVHVRRCCNTGMSHQTLKSLGWTLFLPQRPRRRGKHFAVPAKHSPFKNSFKETMNCRERLLIFARRKRHFRNVASPRRESRAANSRNYIGWPAGPRKALRRSRGRPATWR